MSVLWLNMQFWKGRQGKEKMNIKNVKEWQKKQLLFEVGSGKYENN